MTEWYDFPNVKSTKMLSFLFGSRGLRPDLPSPFGRKFLFCLIGVAVGVWDGRNVFAIYALSLLKYTVASPDPDPNPREGGQLPNPKSAILR